MLRSKRDRDFFVLALLFIGGCLTGYFMREESLLNCIIICALLGAAAWYFLTPWVDKGEV